MTATFWHIVKSEWLTLIRGRWVISYGLVFLILTDSLLRFGGGGPETLLSLSNIMLLSVPLVGMIYGTIYIYQSREFIELLLTQPVNRKTLYRGLFCGIATPLMAAFIIGAGLPLGWHGIFISDAGATLLVLSLGGLLSFIFTALGFVLGLKFFDDRIRGFGIALVIWFGMAILYDGLILMLVFLLSNFPLEPYIIGAMMLNPVDLARILVLIDFDISALMGYTGALFSQLFGTGRGVAIAGSMLMIWLLVPIWIGERIFRRKDF